MSSTAPRATKILALGSRTPITLQNRGALILHRKYIFVCLHRLTIDQVIRRVYFGFTESWRLHQLKKLFYHRIPAYFLDALLLLTGSRPIVRTAFARLDKLLASYSYFTFNWWTWDEENTGKAMLCIQYLTLLCRFSVERVVTCRQKRFRIRLGHDQLERIPLYIHIRHQKIHPQRTHECETEKEVSAGVFIFCSLFCL